ncbi:MAG TPA: (d)CMP kinase [Vicinamibacteria bacterium]|nr:(d)CMP kinase [Vicinamibacteria bacterium]
MRPRGLVIAIDGPSGAGKSTAGRTLADRLGYAFLDTGAMYRALALAALRAGVPLDDAEALADLARRTAIELRPGRVVLLDGEDVSAGLRAQEVGSAASRVSIHPVVRRHMVAAQREMGGQGGIVMDGRDIGTAVFPDADVKFYVDAHPRQRAARRREELARSGQASDLDAIEREIRDRDHADSTRADSPLTRARDAVHLDTTGLGPEEVVGRMMAVVESARGTPGR